MTIGIIGIVFIFVVVLAIALFTGGGEE